MKNNILQLVRIQLLQYFSINETLHTKDKKKKRGNIAILIAIGFTFLMLGGYAFFTNIILVKLNMVNMIPINLLSTASMLVFVLTILRSGGFIFDSKDYDMLAAMPIKYSDIVASRVLTIYITCIFFLLFIMLPGIVVYLINISVNFVSAFSLIMSMFIVPIFPLIIGLIIGSLISVVTMRMKKKKTIITILYFVVFLGIMYLSFQSNLSEEKIGEIVNSVSAKGIFINPLNILYLNVIETGKGIGFFTISLISIGMALLFIKMLGKNLKKINSNINSHASSSNYKMHTLKTTSQKITLYKKELKRYFSSTIYVVNTSFGYVIMIICAIVIFIMGPEAIDKMLGISGSITLLSEYGPIILAGFAIISTTTTASISMEGKNWWLIMSLPIDTKTLFDSKIMVSLTVSVLPTFISSILFAIVLPINIVEGIVLLIVPQIFNLYVAVLGIAVNSRFPKFKWSAEAEVVKQSTAVIVEMILGVISLGGSVLLLFLGKGIGIGKSIIYIIICVIFFLITVTLYKLNNRINLKVLEEK
jgi:ABC-2 type transport system permease protein